MKFILPGIKRLSATYNREALLAQVIILEMVSQFISKNHPDVGASKHTLLPLFRLIINGCFHIHSPWVTAFLDLAQAMPFMGIFEFIQPSVSPCKDVSLYMKSVDTFKS